MIHPIAWLMVFGSGGIFMVNLLALVPHNENYEGSWLSVFIALFWAVYAPIQWRK